MRYDIILFKPFVDIAVVRANACLFSPLIYCYTILTASQWVVLLLLLFTKAILELQSEKYLKIIDEDEVLQMDQKDKSLFVFSSFTSPAFMHCQKV